MLKHQLTGKDKEIVRLQQELDQQRDAVKAIDDDVQLMQSHIERQDGNNTILQAENDKVKRELDNIKGAKDELR